MYRIDTAPAAAALPAPGPVGPNPNGYFTGGNPGTGTAATVLDSDFMNAVQEEICAVIGAAGLALSKTSQNQLLTAIQSLSRIRLAANLNLYVATTGNDGNNGLTAATPFLTIQKAVSYALDRYDAGGYSIIVNIAAGTYDEAVAVSGQMPGPVAAPSSLVLSGASSATTTVTWSSADTISATYGASVAVTGLTVVNTGAGYAALFADRGGLISVQADVVLSSTGGGVSSAANAHIHAEIDILNNVTIGDVSGEAVFASSLGGLVSFSVGVAVTGPVTVAAGFVSASQLGMIYGVGATFSGSTPTGPRYYGDSNAAINTGGGGANFFPGSAAGSTQTGAQYG